ncbi:uncharacterized protein LOC115212809 isoform X9 [Octopus sinensis]|uniref:Uncharacterized protein LOC115212809 isoform X9 n=1 Tax=Octopus sinensis TaxID=2607531 RepID=A0A6P7SHF6_9MOLL|nr:uncharacterized protein LOC115212809 isoform X9 [Octopus sinensis]
MADTQEGSNFDYIVMTPTKKGEATHIKIERKKRLTFEDQKVAHIGGGEHKGLVINNQTADDDDNLGKPQLQLGFACFLVDQKTGDHLVETRKLKFWYVDGTEYLDQVTRAYDFFKELIRPDDFPRDYVGFIKKCMKQMQGPIYTQIRRVELSMQQLDQSEAPLSPEVKVETTVMRDHEIPQTIVYESKLPPPPPPVTEEEKIEAVQITSAEECPLPDIIEDERPLPDVIEEEIQTTYRKAENLPPPSFMVEEVVNDADIEEDLPPPVGVVEEVVSDVDVDVEVEEVSDIDFDEDLPPPVGVVEEVVSDIDPDAEEVISDTEIDDIFFFLSEDKFSAPIIVGMTADGLPKIDNRPKDEILREKMLHILESAYPNILAVEDICRITAADEVMVREQLKELHTRNLVTEMEQGGFMRHVLDEKSEVQLVKQMPTIAANQQPTIAIITAMYYEKLAVDAMMENKTTYMKYKTEGESNVYTIGFIGEHKVVSTKLPAIGHARSAQISSGNTTTRLLGTFQNIEHVFVVGVAGGVPYYTDYYKHVRLGDVVISRGEDRDVIYYYCEKILKNKSGDLQYLHKTFAPKDSSLQQTARKIVETSKNNPESKPWELYLEEGQKLLQGQEVHFMRPSSTTDRLYMNIGEDNVIEVEHPQPPEEIASNFDPDKPRVHYGVLGSGRPVVKSDAIRLDFAGKYNIKAFDTEFDQVLESIIGNRKDSFMFIRGISDYTDGSKNKEWQPYAALTAAAFMKTIIKALTNPLVDDF